MISADLCLDLVAETTRTFSLQENQIYLIAALSSTRLFGYNLLVELIFGSSSPQSELGIPIK
jgi:hypothetical protein